MTRDELVADARDRIRRELEGCCAPLAMCDRHRAFANDVLKTLTADLFVLEVEDIDRREGRA